MFINGLLALAITILSPFIFYSYFETPPESLNQKLTFGGPFPFTEQSFTLPSDEGQYPLEVKFESPFEKDTKYMVTPFVLSFLSFFLFLFALFSIIGRFFKGKPVPEKEPK